MRTCSFALIGLLTFVTSASVQAQMFATPAGAFTSGGNVSANANFTVANGHITLVLTNLFENPTADSQLLNGITFTVNNATSSGALATVNSGNISTISSGGAYSAGISDSLTRWTATETGTSIALTTLSGGKPNDLIIGPDSNNGFDPLKGSYSNANSSITVHNPSVLGSATYNMTVSGVTSASQLSNIVFGFGTTAGSNTVAGTRFTAPATPEPGSLAMFAGMMSSGAVFLAFRRKNQKH